MRKSALIVAVATAFLFGCKSGEKQEMVSDGPIETVSPKSVGQSPETSLAWAGVYEGTSPCADCEGIRTTVELKTDKSFTLSQNRIQENGEDLKFNESGTATWDDNGSLVLETGKYTIRFKVDQNELTLLDMSGNVADGELENFYVLKKK